MRSGKSSPRPRTEPPETIPLSLGMVMRVAMWSGPRNISTAMMRAWESRADTMVCDEPLYARYLVATGADHPGRTEIIAAHEADLTRVIAWLTGPVPAGVRVFYQKHMSHHLLPGDDLAWTGALSNCFLIRDPREMIVSYAKVRRAPTPEELGLPQQAGLFARERKRLGRVPPVIDAADVLKNPGGVLAALCARLGLPWEEGMLSWAPGRRATDGVWAPHWYGAVERSTGFEPWRERREPVPPGLEGVEEACRPLYELMHEHRIVA